MSKLFIRLIILICCIFSSSEKGNALNTGQIDWHIGPLTALYWDMGLNDLPTDFFNDIKESNVKPFLGYDVFSKSFIFQTDYLFEHLTSDYRFSFHGIPIRTQQYDFMGQLIIPQSREFRELPEEHKFIFKALLRKSSDAEVKRTLKLKAIYLFPETNTLEAIHFALEKAFGVSPKINKIDLLFPEFSEVKGDVQLTTQKYKIFTWGKGQNIVKFVNAYNKGERIYQFIMITSDKGFKELQNTISSCSQPRISPTQFNNLIKKMEKKNWEVGFGWLRGQLGIPMKPKFPEVFVGRVDDEAQRENAVYAINMWRYPRHIIFRFDKRGILHKIDFVPLAKPD